MTSETSEITIFVRFHLTLRYLKLTPGMRPLSNEGSPPRLHLHPAIPHQLGLLKICYACFKDPVLPITHCALTIIGGHFLDVEKSEN